MERGLMDGRRVEVVPFSALRWRSVRTDDHLLTPTSFATVSSFLFESRLSGCWGGQRMASIHQLDRSVATPPGQRQQMGGRLEHVAALTPYNEEAMSRCWIQESRVRQHQTIQPDQLSCFRCVSQHPG